jgi:hypothetical protein
MSAYLVDPQIPEIESRSDAEAPSLVPSPVAHALSACLAVATVAAALPTLLVDGALHGTAVMNGSARGTALVMLALGVPLLTTAQLATRRGISAAVPVWLGAIAYLTYNAFLLLFATPFNSLFLLYVAGFSLALWSLVAILRVLDMTALMDRVRPGIPRRAIAVYAWTVVALNLAAWLRAIIPGLSDSASPAFLEGTGLTTVPTYVQDLAVWLPLMGVAAFWLWRGLAWGYLVVSAMLVQWVIEATTVAVDQYLGSSADPTSTVASTSMTPAFALLAVITLVPAALMLRRM